MDYTITTTELDGGTLAEETTIFAEDRRGVFLHISVTNDGAMYVAIGRTAVSGEGIYVSKLYPLNIETPCAGAVHAVPAAGGDNPVYSAARGLS